MTEQVCQGGCHCGRVRFQVTLPKPLVAQSCNCSMCEKVGFIHAIVPKSAMQLLQGEPHLSCYTFNTGVAQHLFCQHCGVKSFYVPRSNPNGYSINVRCLDTVPEQLSVEAFDGQNWEQYAHTLAHLA